MTNALYNKQRPVLAKYFQKYLKYNVYIHNNRHKNNNLELVLTIFFRIYLKLRVFVQSFPSAHFRTQDLFNWKYVIRSPTKMGTLFNTYYLNY